MTKLWETGDYGIFLKMLAGRVQTEISFFQSVGFKLSDDGHVMSQNVGSCIN